MVSARNNRRDGAPATPNYAIVMVIVTVTVVAIALLLLAAAGAVRIRAWTAKRWPSASATRSPARRYANF